MSLEAVSVDSEKIVPFKNRQITDEDRLHRENMTPHLENLDQLGFFKLKLSDKPKPVESLLEQLLPDKNGIKQYKDAFTT